MSYEKQTWATNDVITAEKLNHMEDGIASTGGGSGVLVVNFTNPHATPSLSQTKHRITDKTAGEIKAALETGIVITRSDGVYYGVDPNENEYTATLTRIFNRGVDSYGEFYEDSGICFYEDSGVYKIIYDIPNSGGGAIVLTASSLDDYLLYGTTD